MPLPETARTVIRSGSLIALGACLVVLVAGVVQWAATPPPTDVERVAEKWNATISRLGIEPVYPPQEDFQVGDLYAAVSEVTDASGIPQALSGRAIKVWHIDMREDLERAYAEMPVFPETLPRPDEHGSLWKQPLADGPVFSTSRSVLRTLPLVMFPGFSIADVREGGGGVGWVGSWLGGRFAASGSSSNRTELRVPFAETYGVPSLTAMGWLDIFCSETRTRSVCSERFVRTQLSMVIGKKARDPALRVELWLVNRVYLTRAIEQANQIDSTRGAKTYAALKLAAATERVSENALALEQRSGASAALASLQESIAAQRTQLDELIKDVMSDEPGGTMNVRNARNSSIAVSQLLPRPVAIGFRAVHLSFDTQSEGPK